MKPTISSEDIQVRFTVLLQADNFKHSWESDFVYMTIEKVERKADG